MTHGSARSRNAADEAKIWVAVFPICSNNGFNCTVKECMVGGASG